MHPTAGLVGAPVIPGQFDANLLGSVLGFDADTDISTDDETLSDADLSEQTNDVAKDGPQKDTTEGDLRPIDAPEFEAVDTENIEDRPELLRLISSGLFEFGSMFDRIHQLGLGELEVRNVDIELLDEDKNLLRQLGIPSAVYSETSDDSAARPQQHFVVTTMQDGGDGIDLNVTHVKQNAGDGRAFVVGVRNIIASNFIKKLADPQFPMKLNVPFGLDGEFILDDQRSISRLDLKISAGKGVVETAPNSKFNVDSGALNLTLNRRSQQLIVFQLSANDVYLDSPDANAPALTVDNVIANGAFQLGRKLISVSEFSVQIGDIRGDAAVSFGFDGKTPSMALVAEIEEAPVQVLKQVWPIFIAPSARSWTLKNLHDGVVKNARIVTSIPTGVLGNFNSR